MDNIFDSLCLFVQCEFDVTFSLPLFSSFSSSG